MEFNKYEDNFIRKAKDNNYSSDEIDEMIKYAKVLHGKNVPIIFDSIHLSLILGIDIGYLYTVSNSQKSFYRRFIIKKSDKTDRIIEEPLPILKEIHMWILENILNSVSSSIYTKAFKKNLSIKDNARFHQNQNIVICMDIKDYFGSIPEYKVYELFNKIGYSKQVSTLLAKLCCLNNSIPQGASTSPAISNLVTIDMDTELAKLAKMLSTESYNVRYTRYADDITFSGKSIDKDYLINSVNKIVKRFDFKLNTKKTRVLGRNSRQLVTGIVVNKKMQVSRNKRRELRANMYFINKFGIEDHMKTKKITESKKEYIRKLLGIVNFVLFVNPKDVEFINYKRILNELYNLNKLS